MVIEIDEERRRISLGVKQCKSNPWAEFSATFNRGDKVSGQIKSITDFGIFIGLDGGIDGLVHLSDISWDLPGEEAVRNYKKGQEIEAAYWLSTLSASVSRWASSSWTKIRSQAGLLHIRRTRWSQVRLPKLMRAAHGRSWRWRIGSLRASELARGRVEDARTMIKIGEEVEAKFTNVDRKNRTVALSIKAKEVHEERRPSAATSLTRLQPQWNHAWRASEGKNVRRKQIISKKGSPDLAVRAIIAFISVGYDKQAVTAKA